MRATRTPRPAPTTVGPAGGICPREAPESDQHRRVCRTRIPAGVLPSSVDPRDHREWFCAKRNSRGSRERAKARSATVRRRERRTPRRGPRRSSRTKGRPGRRDGQPRSCGGRRRCRRRGSSEEAHRSPGRNPPQPNPLTQPRNPRTQPRSESPESRSQPGSATHRDSGRTRKQYARRDGDRSGHLPPPSSPRYPEHH